METKTNKSKLEWICYQLKERGIEITPSQAWSAIVEDSGRNIEVANEMLDETADSSVVLGWFAESFTGRPKPIEIKCKYHDVSEAVMWGVFLLGAVFGGGLMVVVMLVAQ